ncbi:MAG TPA: heavy metal-associated domain-containing protein [Cytophagaceae bacterium]|jgi:copper chaperone CopZ
MGRRYYLFLILLIAFYVPQLVQAQVSIGLDGLTCSMCSNSIYKLLQKVDGVKEVRIDLNENIAEVFYKAEISPNYKELSQKIFDAGFSVRYMKANIEFMEDMAKFGNSYIVNGTKYVYIGNEEKIMRGPVLISLVGKGLMAKKELKKFDGVINKINPSSSNQSYYFIF